MKKSASLASAVLALALMLAPAIPAAAANEIQSIEITCRAISIVVDGTEITPTDADGQPVEPFICGGTTYLPVRAVAGALGLSVDWDAKTSTVSLTSGAEANPGSGTPAASNATKKIEITYRDIKLLIDGTEIIPTDANGNTVEPFIYDGTTYLPVRAVASALGVEVGWDGDTGTVYLGEQPKTTYWLLKTETDYNSDDSVNYVDTYTYDQYGLCTAIATHYPDDADNDYTVYRTYDWNGNLIFEDYGDGYSRYAYDDAGALVSDKYYYGGTMTEWRYAYDTAGRGSVTTALQNDQVVSTATRFYDANGDLVKVVVNYPNAPDYSYAESYAYTYNASGLPANVSYSYTGSDNAYGTYRAFTYDAAGRLAVEYQYWVENGEKSYSDTIRYDYDANGCLSAMKYDAGYTIYTYVSITL